MKGTPAKALLRSMLLIVLMLGVSVFLMRDNFDRIIDILWKLQWSDMIILFTLSLLVTFLQGIIFLKIIRLNHHSFRLRDALQNVFISEFISTIFSTTFGKGAQFILLKAKNISWETTCHIGLVDQLMYYIADLSVCGYCIFFYRGFFKQTYGSLWWIALAGLAITTSIFIGLILLYIPFVNNLVLVLAQRSKQKVKPKGKIDQLIVILIKFVLEVRTSMNNKSGNGLKYLGVIGLNVIKVLVRNSLMFVVIYLLNNHVSIDDFPIYFASACFLEMALCALPVYGDKGTAEIGFVLVFGAMIGQVQATSAMLVWRFFSFYMSAFTGAMVLGMSKKIHLRALLQSENEQK